MQLTPPKVLNRAQRAMESLALRVQWLESENTERTRTYFWEAWNIADAAVRAMAEGDNKRRLYETRLASAERSFDTITTYN